MIIFTYGTLRKGRNNHGFLKGCKYLGEAYTSTEYSLIVSGLPYLVERPGDGCLGELYEVDQKSLKYIDRLEGHPDFYERKPITVYTIDDNQEVNCEAYIHPDIFNKSMVKNYTIVRSF